MRAPGSMGDMFFVVRGHVLTRCKSLRRVGDAGLWVLRSAVAMLAVVTGGRYASSSVPVGDFRCAVMSSGGADEGGGQGM